LILHGYLEIKEDRHRPDLKWTAFTRRGASALKVVVQVVRARRWTDFPFREGDIVISTVPKSGTTWLQMICALLIFQTPDLPVPLQELSPWLDDPENERHQLFTKLQAQNHRRIIKTHAALNEILIDPRVTYIVAARHPLDIIISGYNQWDTVLRGRIERRYGQDQPARIPTPHEWMLRTIDQEYPREDALSRIMRHISDAWTRCSEQDIVLIHYADLSADLEGQMRRLSARLGISVPTTTWPSLVEAASFEQMRAAADRIQPLGNIKDPAAFFRRGKSGVGRTLLTDAELARYYARAAQLAPADLLAWLHREDGPV
jgi:hypothetical protein